MNIELVNLRYIKPKYDYDYVCDRSNLILGNHIGKNLSRLEAIEKFKQYIEIYNEDILNEFDKLYNILLKYQQLRLFCWCYPLNCHTQIIKEKLIQYCNIRNNMKNNKLKIIIAGSRTIIDYEYIKNKTVKIFQLLKQQGYNMDKSNIHNIEIVSGNADGVDKLGERFAQEFGLKLTLFPAKWSLGRNAGILRNIEMIKYIQPYGKLIAFNHNNSK